MNLGSQSDMRNAPSEEGSSKEHSFVIRRAARDDLDDIVDIWLDGAFQSWGVNPPERPVVHEFFSTRFDATALPYGIWVAARRDEILGWQGLQQHYPNPFFRSALSSTYIREKNHGRGIGRALLKFGMEHAKTAGIENMFGHILCENQASIRLVESLGWTKVGIIPLARPKVYFYYSLAVEEGADLQGTPQLS